MSAETRKPLQVGSGHLDIDLIASDVNPADLAHRVRAFHLDLVADVGNF